MLSKNKASKAVANWVGDQLRDARHRGASLVDESGGDSIRIYSVRQAGSTLFIEANVSDSSDQHESLELCLKINRQAEFDALKSAPATTPTQAELSDLDGTA